MPAVEQLRQVEEVTRRDAVLERLIAAFNDNVKALAEVHGHLVDTVVAVRRVIEALATPSQQAGLIENLPTIEHVPPPPVEQPPTRQTFGR